MERMRERYILYVKPIGAAGPQRTEFSNADIARNQFEQSCTPILTVEVWLLYAGPNPIFPNREMTTILAYWHMSQKR